MANSSISTLMGPTGPKGPTAPDGSVGASGNTGPSGSSGPSGLTGAGISADAGLTNCNQRLLQNIDGDYFVIGPIDGATGVLVDNETVVKNSTIPSSTLQKIHNAICYHFVREAVAAKIIRIAYIPTDQNLADMFTKIIGAVKLKQLVKKILY